jgi:polyhydroxybutyrate depolymerase
LSPADDVGFIRALIAELQRAHHADPKRIYATGISNGGFFSNRLACDLTDKLAAIAAVAATMPETLLPVCKPSAQAGEFWRKWDRTSSSPVVENFADQAHDGTSVRREAYAGSKEGTEVVVYTIEGGGHTWPGGPQYLPAFLIGKASHNLDGTRAIWEFFKKHTR